MNVHVEAEGPRCSIKDFKNQPNVTEGAGSEQYVIGKGMQTFV